VSLGGGLSLAPVPNFRMPSGRRAQRRRITGQSDAFVSRARRTVESEFPACVISTCETGLERPDRRARRFVRSVSPYRCAARDEGRGEKRLNIPRHCSRIERSARGKKEDDFRTRRATPRLASPLPPPPMNNRTSLCSRYLATSVFPKARHGNPRAGVGYRCLRRNAEIRARAHGMGESSPRALSAPADFRWRESTPRLRGLACLLPACERFRSRAVSILPCNRAMRRSMRPRSSFSVYLPRTRQRIAAGRRVCFSLKYLSRKRRTRRSGLSASRLLEKKSCFEIISSHFHPDEACSRFSIRDDFPRVAFSIFKRESAFRLARSATRKIRENRFANDSLFKQRDDNDTVTSCRSESIDRNFSDDGKQAAQKVLAHL